MVSRGGGDPSQTRISSASPSIIPVPTEEADQYDIASPGVSEPEPRHPDAAVAVRDNRHLPAPSEHVEKYLFQSERYVGEWRFHWIKVLGWAILSPLLPFPAGYLAAMADELSPLAAAAVLAGFILGQLAIGWHIIEWWHGRFVLTNKRVMLISGLLTRRVGMMPLARITDMAYEQSPLGRLLNYGAFIFESAGQDQALSTVKPLPHPRELYLVFCQEMYDPGDAGFPTIEDAD